MGNVHVVGPNQAMVISGGCGSNANTKRYITGGYGWAWCCVTDVQKISLAIITLTPTCDHVETAEGVPLTVNAVAQCKVMSEPELLETACEQLMGKSLSEIYDTILQTLEGHLRAILGTMTVELIYKDREQFAKHVRDVASPDIGKMGIEILSFTIKDVGDDVDYLDSLGRSRTAMVKGSADVGVAEALRDAGIREAQCQRENLDVKYKADAQIADSKREFQMRQAGFVGEINTAKADAELAYELEASKMKQLIRAEEIQIDVVERKKLIQIEEQEILRRERELSATVKLPAEAESFKVETLAAGQRSKTVSLSQASASRIRLVGAAQASQIEVVGKAEAEKMRQKATSYKSYESAAVTSMVLQSLPKLAAEVAAPLRKVNEVVMLSGDSGVTDEVSRLIGSLPPTVKALTGVDLTDVVSKAIGGTAIARK